MRNNLLSYFFTRPHHERGLITRRSVGSGTKRLALCIGCLACSLALYAGEVILVGDVLNESTGEPIPNVHLYLQGTQQGTVSNEEGSFCLRADIDRKRRLIISAVGYHTQRYDIEPNTMAGMQVLLREKTNLLAEVVALPGENPAIPLIAQVRAHRAENDRTLQRQEQGTKNQEPRDRNQEQPQAGRPRPQYLSGSEQTWFASTELYISHIGKRQLQRHLWKSLRAGLLTTDDSTFLLPLYRSTQPVQLIGKEIRPAGEKQEQALILSASDYSVLLTPPQNLNFYLNSLDILGESFLSPLASSGNTYYHYFLADSVPGAYLVHFRTKNPFYATFNGEMWIDSATYAVQSVYAEVPAQSRVNYLSQLQIRQQFAPDHSLRHEQISVLLDFAVKTDTTHLFPTVLMRTEVVVEPRTRSQEQRPNSADSETSETKVISPSSCVLHPSSQESPLSSLDSLPLIRVAKFAATVLTTGYIPTGTCVDIGNIREILDFGESEYVHLGLPLRTNERLWKNVSLEAAAGYGFHDQRWKGLGRVSINLPTLRRNILRIEYEDHYIATEVDGMYPYYHENFFGKRRFDLTALLFRNLYTNAQAQNTYSRQREFRIETENDWSDLLETRLYAHVGRWDPWYTEHATRNLAPGILATAPYRYQSLGAVFRLSWGERKVDGYFLRRYVHSQYPTLFLSAEAGSVQNEGLNSSDYDFLAGGDAYVPGHSGAGGYSMYAKLQVLVKQRARLGMGGTLDWAFSAGYIFGNVPYPMLHHFEGNQSYAFDPYRFTLMNNLQHSARGWLSLHALWDGQGVLFNLIPGIRYCRLHELVDFKLAWGDGDLLCSPYTEVGVGIGNIFRVGEVYVIWRLTNRQDLTTPTWGIRFRFKLGL